MLFGKRASGDGLPLQIFQVCARTKQESHAVARKPRDAAAVLSGLKFADDMNSLQV